jgi:hypothetical protein
MTSVPIVATALQPLVCSHWWWVTLCCNNDLGLPLLQQRVRTINRVHARCPVPGENPRERQMWAGPQCVNRTHKCMGAAQDIIGPPTENPPRYPDNFPRSYSRNNRNATQRSCAVPYNAASRLLKDSCHSDFYLTRQTIWLPPSKCIWMDECCKYPKVLHFHVKVPTWTKLVSSDKAVLA